MASFDYTSAPKAVRLAMLAIFATSILCVLSQLSLKFNGLFLSFGFVPSLAVYLWPKGANAALSLVGVFGLGMFQSLLGFGPAGLWAFIWVVFFVMYRPDIRDRARDLGGLWIGCFGWLLAIALAHVLLGWLMLNIKPDPLSLTLSCVCAFMAFPLVWFARRYFSRLLDGEDEYGLSYE